MEELCDVQRELQAIGVNINQITRHFNSTADARQKMLYAHKANDQNRTVEANVDRLLDIVIKLSGNWLPDTPPEPGPLRMGRYPLNPQSNLDG